MNRRDFLRRASLIAAGVVAADQIELLDRLGWTRKIFPAAVPTIMRHDTYTWGLPKDMRDKAYHSAIFYERDGGKIVRMMDFNPIDREHFTRELYSNG